MSKRSSIDIESLIESVSEAISDAFYDGSAISLDLTIEEGVGLFGEPALTIHNEVRIPAGEEEDDD